MLIDAYDKVTPSGLGHVVWYDRQLVYLENALDLQKNGRRSRKFPPVILATLATA